MSEYQVNMEPDAHCEHCIETGSTKWGRTTSTRPRRRDSGEGATALGSLLDLLFSHRYRDLLRSTQTLCSYCTTYHLAYCPHLLPDGLRQHNSFNPLVPPIAE